MSAAVSNLLDEALGGAPPPSGSFVLVEDCAETSGAFVLHHLLKRSLPPSLPRGAVILLAFAHPFSHYDRILRKLGRPKMDVLLPILIDMQVHDQTSNPSINSEASPDDLPIALRKLGCNLSTHRDTCHLHFIDMLNLEFQDPLGATNNASENGSMELFGKIQKAVAAACGADHFVIMIDDISLLEIAAHGSADCVLDTLHYCATLTSGLDGSIIVMDHADVYSTNDLSKLLFRLEYLADIVIKVQPLVTGLAADVHGQLVIINKKTDHRQQISRHKVNNFHFRVKENGVDYFYPGKQF